MLATTRKGNENDATILIPGWIQLRGELMAAIFCGMLILFAWLMDVRGFIMPSVILYLLAYFIGGFAKAKEGLIDTVENKELNVELLMVLAAIGSAIIGYWADRISHYWVLGRRGHPYFYFFIKWCVGNLHGE